MTHTKGNWYTANTGNHQGLVVSDSNGANVCVTYDKQDATIIAAAPEMLEALKSVLDVYGDQCGNGCITDECCICRTRDAISLAEGR